MLYELIWFMNPVPCGMHKTPVNIGIYYYLYVYLLTAAGDLLDGFDPFCHDKSPFVEYVVYRFRRSKNKHLHPKTNMSPENRAFPNGKPIFQGRAVSFREDKLIKRVWFHLFSGTHHDPMIH